ncbi:MAG: signal peptidase II [Candidatus Omnitrophica bacterium]|nr:signal peptidase II [Candidatus Omnitrophota bacterium]
MLDKQRSPLDIIVFLSTVCGVILLDRLTKIFFSTLLHLNESWPIIRKVFHFTLVHNTGIAFGLFKNNGFVFFIVPAIAIALLAYNIYYYHKFGELDRIYIIAFSLILGGAIGNLVDRISLGYVVDFIDFRIWPVFNIADSAITIGACIILFKCFPLTKTKEEKKMRVILKD